MLRRNREALGMADPLNKWQVKVINDAPSLYRSTLERAYAGKSRSAAIRGTCLRCVGFVRADIRDCTAYGCPLHPYRPYQADTEADDSE